ncbi:MAG: hypothetical protein K2Y08_01535 [Alphaproteobacteria bacterium]|nr:hypothetical protein [Alphaproteobacteria bacterium]
MSAAIQLSKEEVFKDLDHTSQKRCYILDSENAQALSLASHLRAAGFIVEKSSYKFLEHVNPSHEFLETIITLLNEGVYVIPTGVLSTRWLLSNVNTIKFGDLIFSAENLKVYNKFWLLDVAQKLNVPIPQTYMNIQNIPAYMKSVFYKNNTEGANKRLGILDLPAKDDFNCNGLLFQEIITGHDTYGVGFIAENGIILTLAPHHEIISSPALGGSAAVIEKFHDSRLLDYTTRLVQELKYTGWGLAEYKFCDTRNDFVLMEINAKFWASLEFTLQAYPEFSKCLMGKKVYNSSVKNMIFLDRLLLTSPSTFLKRLWEYRYCTLHCEYRSLLKRLVKFFVRGFSKSQY